MASTGAAQPSPQVVGAAFVQQYYYVLHRSPDQVHKFYQDSSILSRPDSNGMMTTVTTIQAINEKLLSLDFSNYTAEIESADSQASYKEGVLVVVTGSLTGRDNVCRKFTQSFFLAPQERGGYVVLNDIFRFVDPGHLREMNQVLVNGTTAEVSTSLSTPELEPAVVSEPLVTNTVEHENVLPVVDHDNGNEVINAPENGVSEEEDAPASDQEFHSSQSDDQPTSDVTASMSQEDGHKKSYASIVSKPKSVVPKGASLKPAPSNHEKQLSPSPKPTPSFDIPVPTSNNVPESNSNNAVEGYSIYIRNLPLSTTPVQVEEEFKTFGPIKKGGVQVRNHKVERFCFGFVEFESLDSMQAAIKASPITLGGRQVYIEEKRTTTRVVNGVVTHGGNGAPRGRYQSGRGGYLNDNFRGRGSFGNNQGYVRTEFRGRGEYSGRGRGGYGRPSSSYQQRPFQNGNGKIFRPLSASQTAVSV
ncbi:hypothetical protein HPP92_009479 [Vanilla planifolia]|uniref:Uncharacterized protein n=1 Tax=Vanilla planifolia TaxID=51239 RepID=A0A835RCG1_VANPL|nr:hypothetical protein HPP92_009479 [Vanilla planifolia]